MSAHTLTNTYASSQFAHDDLASLIMYMPTCDEQASFKLEALYSSYGDALYRFARHGLKNGYVREFSNMGIQHEENTCLQQAALRAVSNLPVRNREVIELVCLHDYNVAEAAMIVDCAVNVAAIRLSYARKKINAALQNQRIIASHLSNS